MTIEWVTRTSTYRRVDDLFMELWIYYDHKHAGFVVREVPDETEWFLLADDQDDQKVAVYMEHTDAYNAANRYVEERRKKANR